MPTQRTCGATMLDRFKSSCLKFRFLKFRCLKFTSACVRHREIRLQQG
jgi:hypothetical protein